MPEDNGFPLLFVQASEELGRYAETKEKVRLINSRFPHSQYPKVLDICCGLGHFAIALTNQGYKVTGLDLSSDQIEYARKECPAATFMVGDMRHPPGGQFDLVLNTYSSFGYLETVEEDQRALCAWARALKPGGVLVMELSDLERACCTFTPSRSRVERQTGGVTERLSFDFTSQVLTAVYELDGQSFETTTRIYSSAQLVAMLKAAGFDGVCCSGDFGGREKRATDRLVLVCSRP